MHFPIPNARTVADVVLESSMPLKSAMTGGASLGVGILSLLNCGFRLAAAGGPTKIFPTRASGPSAPCPAEPGEPFALRLARRCGRQDVLSSGRFSPYRRRARARRSD